MGLAMRRAYEMYLEWLHSNRGGLMVGGVRHPVELLLLDDRSDADEAAWVTRRLITTSGIRLLLGPYSSSLSEAAAAVADELGAVMVAPVAGSPSVYAGRPRIFGTLSASSSFMVEPMAAVAATAACAEAPGRCSVASLQEDVGFLRGVCAEVPRLADLHSLRLGVQTTVPVNAGDADVAAAVASIVADGPDVVVGCVYESVCHMLLRAIEARDFEPHAIILTTCVTERLVREVGYTASAYTLGAVPWSKALQSTSTLAEGWTAASFSETYAEKFGEEPPYQAASAFSAVAALVSAISRAGSTEPSAVASVLASFDEPSIFGQLVFDGEGQSLNPVKAVQIQREPYPVLVAPLDVAERPLVFPRPTRRDLFCLDLNNETLGLFGFFVVDDDLVCQRCADGHLSRVSLLTRPDTSTPELRRACEACPAGRRLVKTGSEGVFCADCSAGTEAPNAGMQRCTPCQPGRFSQSQGGITCEECSPGKYQSAPSATQCIGCEFWHQGGNGSAFQEASGSVSCSPCPLGALCELDGEGRYSQFTSADGYYVIEVPVRAASDNISDGEAMIFRCPHNVKASYNLHGDEDNACLARQTCRPDPTTGEPASMGPLCGVCRPGYARADAAKICRHCPDTFVLLLLAGTTSVIIVVIVLIMVLSVRVRDALQPKHLRGIVLKQMINYFHMMAIIVSVSDMPQLAALNYWFSLMQVVFGVIPSEPASLAAACLFRRVAPGLGASRAATLLGIFMMPIFLLAVLCGFYLCKAICSFRGRPHPKRSALVTVLVITVFVIHPRVTRLCLQTFVCRYFDVPRLLEQTDILCESSEHIGWQVVGFFGFLICSCGVPIGLGLMLRTHSKANTLYEAETISMLGFLFNGFEETQYYTESWFMLRKALFQAVVLIPGLSATDPGTSAAVQNTSLLALSIACLALHMASEPFDNRGYCALDHIETAMLWAVVVTCLAQTWLYVSDGAWLFGEDQDVGWLNFRNTTCGAAVFFSHGLFWLRVLGALLRETRFASSCPLFFPDDGEITIRPGFLDTSQISQRARESLSIMLGEIAVMHLDGGKHFLFEKFVASLQATTIDAVRLREDKAANTSSYGYLTKLQTFRKSVRSIVSGQSPNGAASSIRRPQASGEWPDLRGLVGSKCTVEELQLATIRLRVSRLIDSYDRCDLDGFEGLSSKSVAEMHGQQQALHEDRVPAPNVVGVGAFDALDDDTVLAPDLGGLRETACFAACDATPAMPQGVERETSLPVPSSSDNGET